MNRQPDVCTACHVELCEACHSCHCDRGEDWICGASDCPGTPLPLSELPLDERDPEAEEVWRDMQRKA